MDHHHQDDGYLTSALGALEGVDIGEGWSDNEDEIMPSFDARNYTAPITDISPSLSRAAHTLDTDALLTDVEMSPRFLGPPSVSVNMAQPSSLMASPLASPNEMSSRTRVNATSLQMANGGPHIKVEPGVRTCLQTPDFSSMELHDVNRNSTPFNGLSSCLITPVSPMTSHDFHGHQPGANAFRSPNARLASLSRTTSSIDNLLLQGTPSRGMPPHRSLSVQAGPVMATNGGAPSRKRHSNDCQPNNHGPSNKTAPHQTTRHQHDHSTNSFDAAIDAVQHAARKTLRPVSALYANGDLSNCCPSNKSNECSNQESNGHHRAPKSNKQTNNSNSYTALSSIPVFTPSQGLDGLFNGAIFLGSGNMGNDIIVRPDPDLVKLNPYILDAWCDPVFDNTHPTLSRTPSSMSQSASVAPSSVDDEAEDDLEDDNATKTDALDDSVFFDETVDAMNGANQNHHQKDAEVDLDEDEDDDESMTSSRTYQESYNGSSVCSLATVRTSLTSPFNMTTSYINDQNHLVIEYKNSRPGSATATRDDKRGSKVPDGVEIRHSGKARKGDGTDLRPDPSSLYRHGVQIANYTSKIAALAQSSHNNAQHQAAMYGGSATVAPSSGADMVTSSCRVVQPDFVQPQNFGFWQNEEAIKKEKNKLASRSCRMKKKARHETNKIIFFGQRCEHLCLCDTLRILVAALLARSRMVHRADKRIDLSSVLPPESFANNAAKSRDVATANSSITNFTDLFTMIHSRYGPPFAVAPNPTAYVESVLLAVKNGSPTGNMPLEKYPFIIGGL